MGEEIKIVLARAMLNSLCKFGADNVHHDAWSDQVSPQSRYILKNSVE